METICNKPQLDWRYAFIKPLENYKNRTWKRSKSWKQTLLTMHNDNVNTRQQENHLKSAFRSKSELIMQMSVEKTLIAESLLYQFLY